MKEILKPFNVEEAKKGAKIITKDGHPVKILAYEVDEKNSITALVSDNKSDNENISETMAIPYFADGHYYHSLGSGMDLMIREVEFEDGDVVSWNDNNSVIGILQNLNKSFHSSYATLTYEGIIYSNVDMWINLNMRLATKEEKQKLFEALKEENKRWNVEKKCIEDIPKEVELKNRYGAVIYVSKSSNVSTAINEAIALNIDLTLADFSKLNLEYICFSDTVCNNIDFSNSHLSNVTFNKCILSDTLFDRATLDLCYYENSLLTNVSFNDSKISHTKFRTNLCHEYSFDRAEFVDSSFDNNKFNTIYGFETAKNVPYISDICLPEGTLIGWKIFDNGDFKPYFTSVEPDFIIAKLEIPKNALKSKSVNGRCRCDKVRVLEFQDILGNRLFDIKSVTSYTYGKCTYTINEMTYPDKWDSNVFKECSNGIHFFLNRKDAVGYCNSAYIPIVKVERQET